MPLLLLIFTLKLYIQQPHGSKYGKANHHDINFPFACLQQRGLGN